MTFDNPGAFVLFFLFLVFIPFLIIRYRKGRQRATLFAAAAPSHERKALLSELRRRMVIADIFFMLFFGLLVIALAGPRWGVRIVADHRRGVDVVLAFDLSRSMNVRDCFPQRGQLPVQDRISRMERGMVIARELTTALGDVRLGIAIGKGRGVLAVPLTHDSDMILNFLYSLDSQAITGGGTNLESLITAASGSFQDSVPSRRAVILFSDGEAHSGSFQGAVEKARKAGIAISAVGLGSDEGGPVPVEKGPGASDGFLLTEDGIPVISARQADSLRNGAGKTGGVYVDGGRNDAVQALLSFVNSLSAESRLSGYRREANPRWQIFVLAAMAFLGGSRIMGFSRRSHRRQYAKGESSGKKALLLSVLFCGVFFNSCDRVQGKLLIMEGNFFNARGFHTEAISSYLRALDHETPYAEYALGSAYFALEEGSAALERYEAAEKSLRDLRPEYHAELRYRIYYNRGIIYFEKGDYEDAVRSFREALKIDGSRIDAKRNLELSLLTIARSPPPAPVSPQGRPESGATGSDGGGSVLFEYLTAKEHEQWKSREWTGESDFSGPDY